MVCFESRRIEKSPDIQDANLVFCEDKMSIKISKSINRRDRKRDYERTHIFGIGLACRVSTYLAHLPRPSPAISHNLHISRVPYERGQGVREYRTRIWHFTCLTQITIERRRQNEYTQPTARIFDFTLCIVLHEAMISCVYFSSNVCECGAMFTTSLLHCYENASKKVLIF